MKVVRSLVAVAALSLVGGVLVAAPAHATPGAVVISQVYGGGGNTGATFANDFIELFNRSNSSVDISGWAVQYGSATGTTWAGPTLAAATLAPGQYFL
ncbi:MAG: lamin tail domain-containing protein, partial [Mycobacteriales bacterium]